jgi:hypothetical protein
MTINHSRHLDHHAAVRLLYPTCSPMPQLWPVHRTIVAVDIEASTARTDAAKARLRTVMYDVLESALRSCGITHDHHDPLIDRGDGALVLIHPVDHAPKTLLLNKFIPTLHELLTEYGAHNPDPLRLRAAIHAGEIYQDRRGWFGEALDFTCRLLDSPESKAALRRTQKPLVLVVSDHIFHTVIRHTCDDNPHETYTPLINILIGGHQHLGWIHAETEGDCRGQHDETQAQRLSIHRWPRER